MGALTINIREHLTICPNAPFRVNAVSLEPVSTAGLYGGDPHNAKNVDTIVFPSGLARHPDGQSLYLSFGWQDRHAAIARLDIHGLFASLHNFFECSSEERGD
jgi:sugar lactone lactonase YvrE